jgi:ribosomal protein L11 methyltransferase
MILRPPALETVSVEVPAHALEAYEAALGSVCASVGFFLDEDTGTWRVEGVKQVGSGEAELAAGLALAEMMTGATAAWQRSPTEAGGWLARRRRFPSSASAGASSFAARICLRAPPLA